MSKIIAKMANGDELQFPAGTPDEVVNKAVQDYLENQSGVFGDAGTQRVRNIMQGLTFNTADEAEALARSLLTDKTYEEAVGDIRSDLKLSQQRDPLGTAGYQMLGAAAPTIGALALTRGKVKAPVFANANQSAVFQRFFPNLFKVMGLGAAESAAAGVGAREGTLRERTEGITTDLTTGAVGSGALQVGGTGLMKGASLLVDLGRRFGQNISTDRVNREVQRIVSEMRDNGNPLTEDQIVERLLNGQILADDPQVAQEIRALAAAGGGEIQPVLAQLRNRRPRVQAEAIEVLESGLGAGTEKNVVRIARMGEAQLRRETQRAYRNIDEVPASAPVYQAMRNVLMRSTSALNKINAAYRAQTGKAPFFRYNDELDRFEFDRAPTNLEAEQLRRIIAEEADALIEKGGAGASIGIGFGDASTALRNAIDNEYPDIVAARRTAQNAFEVNTAFKQGNRADQNFDEAQVVFEDLQKTGNTRAIDAYKLGYLARLKNKFGRATRRNTLKSLLDETKDIGKVFRMVFPEEQMDEAFKRLGIAESAAQAYDTIFGNSITANILLRNARQGNLAENVGTAQAATIAVTNRDVFMAIQVMDRFIKSLRPNLTESQRGRIAQRLAQEDPKLILDSLKDNSAMRQLQINMARLVGIPLQTASVVGGIQAAQQVTPDTAGNE